MACPGSLNRSRGLPDNSSPYAIEGTAAHTVAAECLTQTIEAIEYLGRFIEVPTYGPEGDVVKKTRIHVDEEMVDGVQLYLNLCQEESGYGFNDDMIVFIETRVSLNELFPDFPKPLFGTCDFGCYNRRTRKLTVIDFKYGAGVIVMIDGKPQTRFYALGLAASEALSNEIIETVEVIICQPRGFGAGETPVRRQTLAMDQLLEWGEKELLPALWATLEPDAPLVAGDHCLFCRASHECETLREHALKNAMILFDPLTVMPVGKVELLPPQRLSPDQISQLLDVSSEMMLWLRAVREYAFGLMNAGVKIPKWKIVGKKGRRRWSSDDPNDTLLALMFLFGMPHESLLEAPKLKSPRQVELAVRKIRGQEAKEICSQIGSFGLYETPSTGTTLAREEDVRPSLEGLADIAMFERLDP
jgi:hypothetical protein